MFQHPARLPLLALCCVSAPALAAVPELKPGKWQVTMTNETAGEKAASFTMTQCMDRDMLTSQYAASGATDGKTDGETSGDEGGCRFKSVQKDNTVTMETACDGETTTTVGTYAPDSFLIDSATASKNGSGKVVMEGKRLGDC